MILESTLIAVAVAAISFICGMIYERRSHAGAIRRDPLARYIIGKAGENIAAGEPVYWDRRGEWRGAVVLGSPADIDRRRAELGLPKK